jgi:hypothetical protein
LPPSRPRGPSSSSTGVQLVSRCVKCLRDNYIL